MSLLAAAIVAACGNDSNHHLPDAPQGSDGNDAPVATDAPVAGAAVTVIVTAQGDAAANVTVYFLAADNTVVSTTTTDLGGSASAIVAAGASVTVIEPTIVGGPRPRGSTNESFTLDTWNGVQPGDTLHLDVDPPDGSGVDEASFDLDLQDDDDATIFTYLVSSTCGSTTVEANSDVAGLGRRRKLRPRVDGSMTTDCTGSADFVVIANDSNGVPVDSLYAPNLDIENDTTLAITGTYTTVDDGTVMLSNIPAFTTDVEVERDLFGPNGLAFATDVDVQPEAGTGVDQAPFPPASTIAGTTVATIVHEDNNGGDGAFDRQEFVQWGPPADGYQLDLSTVELPHYTSPPNLDTTAHQVTWTSGSAAVAPDAELVTVTSQRQDGAFVDSWTWRIAAPASEYGAVQMPTLPTDVFDFTIEATDIFDVTSALAFSVPGGYDALRAFAFETDFEGLGATGSGTASESFLAPSLATGGGRRAHRRAHMTVAHRRR